jgi:hypothetical protein
MHALGQSSMLRGSDRAGVVCGTTDFGQAWDCRAPAVKGSWDVQSEDECLAKCVGCDLCRYVSLVPPENQGGSSDCSWFSECALHSPHLQAVRGALSKRVRTRNGTVLESVARIAQRQAKVEREDVVARHRWATSDGLRRHWLASLDDCKVGAHPEQCRCFARHALQLLPWPDNAEVFNYFYNASLTSRFRTVACNPSSRHLRGNGNSWDQLYEPREGGSPDCLWSNMPFGKSIAIILLARALRVDHIIESGRMGGLSLIHYDRFGFGLTSIEFAPLPAVSAALRRRIPSITLRDGDGSLLVPSSVDSLLRRAPGTRIAVIIDGPKGRAARAIARQVAPRVAMIVLDDQNVAGADDGRPPKDDHHVASPELGAALITSDRIWRAAFPMGRDALFVDAASAHHFKESDTASILLGGRWKD